MIHAYRVTSAALCVPCSVKPETSHRLNQQDVMENVQQPCVAFACLAVSRPAMMTRATAYPFPAPNIDLILGMPASKLVSTAACYKIQTWLTTRSTEVELTASDEDLVCPILISELRSVAFTGFLKAIVNGRQWDGQPEAQQGALSTKNSRI